MNIIINVFLMIISTLSPIRTGELLLEKSEQVEIPEHFITN